jgi:hypothetical protein
MIISQKIPVLFFSASNCVSEEEEDNQFYHETKGFIYFNLVDLSNRMIRLESYVEEGELHPDKCNLVVKSSNDTEEIFLIDLSPEELIQRFKNGYELQIY